MRLIQGILIMGILLVSIGCQTEETPADKLIVVEAGETKGYCALTAINESDGSFLMADKLFSEGVSCNTNDDCYDFLLEQDDFRSLTPEFYPYLSCEKTKKSIAPNKMI